MMTLNDRMNLLIAENEQLKAEVAELKDQVSILSQHPEFELPTLKSCALAGLSEQVDENICKCCTCGYQWIRGQNGSHSCAEYLKQELDITNSILSERQKLLDAIPGCEVHGKCVPHAIEWVKSMNKVISENEQLKAERLEMLTKFGELNRDKLRLDLLDEVNSGFNEQNGTLYGWVVDWNHNRICLRDSDPMKKSVRQAIDEFALRVNKAGSA